MACTSPKRAWKYGQTENGKTNLVFKRPEYSNAEEIQIPCGKCISCKLAYSREWATRCVHEAQTSLISSFLTLTYDEQNLPPDGSVSKTELKLFIKNLRRQLQYHYNAKIKFFACGEYGSKRDRPHYHVIVFGWDFPDKTYWSKTDSGCINYRSKFLEKIWTKGISTVGEVTYQSAAYVARYTLKKTKTKHGYEHVDTETGQIIAPEFVTMSNGIGSEWWQKYKTDTDKDYLNVNYQKQKIPRYYDKKLEEIDPEKLIEQKNRRALKAKEHHENETKSLRKSKNIVKLKQSTMLQRGYEHE